MKQVLSSFHALALRAISEMERWVRPLFDLGLRVYLWKVFFTAGWLKLTDWSGTLDLFDYFYHVPLLPPHLAAVMGTAGEVGLSTLLLFGLAGRFAAAGLFVTNLMAALSFPDLPLLGLKDHCLWGLLLLVQVFHGTGTLSLDRLASRWLAKPH
ncbi:MAG: DoxX family protein [Paludibacterium sp.]|uniref:DoxX family protein n=1 Tax=Paludibacterium sp. TaxID=1917523 RepID=UPI0025E6B07F|nr:DoxX family protein [Paludibacterium sp.]MBV8046499.1 DoxX family protein [Paludibacterium sp.]MBV8646547.1 DoxX family protein [Paludibacterium sp.]